MRTKIIIVATVAVAALGAGLAYAQSTTTTSTITTTTSTATSTASSTPAIGSISLNMATGTPGSFFTVNGSGFMPSENVMLDFNGSTTTIVSDVSGNFSALLNVPSSTVNTSTPVTITATGKTSGTTASTTFTIMPFSTASTTVTSTPDLATLQSEVAQLQAALANLITEVQNFIRTGNFSPGVPNTGFPPSNMSATIDDVGPVRTRTSVDFTGRNWGMNEPVQVSVNGTVIKTAHADAGGNFSTGSLHVASAAGPQAFTFTGQTSGLTRTVTVNIVP